MLIRTPPELVERASAAPPGRPARTVGKPDLTSVWARVENRFTEGRAGEDGAGPRPGRRGRPQRAGRRREGSVPSDGREVDGSSRTTSSDVSAGARSSSAALRWACRQAPPAGSRRVRRRAQRRRESSSSEAAPASSAAPAGAQRGAGESSAGGESSAAPDSSAPAESSAAAVDTSAIKQGGTLIEGYDRDFSKNDPILTTWDDPAWMAIYEFPMIRDAQRRHDAVAVRVLGDLRRPPDLDVQAAARPASSRAGRRSTPR